MSKDKRKKKFFQGMEHLQAEVKKNAQISPQPPDSSTPLTSLEQTYIRKDLLGVIILMSLIVLILVGLTIIDKKTDKLTIFAEKVTSMVIK